MPGSNLDYWGVGSAQGRGIATEATNALLRYAFHALGVRRVGLTHSSGNEASRRIAEKLGFVSEGIQREASLLPGGRIVDRHCYASFGAAGLPPVALFELRLVWFAALVVLNALYNLYPVWLQQYLRLRMQRLARVADKLPLRSVAPGDRQ